MPLVDPKEISPEELETLVLLSETQFYCKVLSSASKKKKGIFRDTKYDGPFYLVTDSVPCFIVASASSEEKIQEDVAMLEEQVATSLEGAEKRDVLRAIKELAESLDGGSSIGASIGNMLTGAVVSIMSLEHTFEPADRDTVHQSLFCAEIARKAYKMDEISIGADIHFDHSGKTLHVVYCSEISDTVYWYFGFDTENPQDFYVGFRGTKETKDVLIDAAAALEKCEMKSYTFSTHIGMKTVLKKRIPEIVNMLNEYAASGQLQSITYTGHSLGGGYALIAYSIIRGKSFKSSKNCIFNAESLLNIPTRVYTYGAPIILGKKSSWNEAFYSQESNIFNFIHNYDIVPRLLGTKTFANILKTLMKVLPEDSEKSRDLLSGFADHKVISHMGEYKVFGNFFWLRTLRTEENGKVYDTKYKCSMATTPKDKKRIASLPFPEMTKLGLPVAVKLCLPDHFSNNYVNHLKTVLEKEE
eukprot:TRINITY_DN5739_c0_g1_i1.p1 TRINITY_DN5739_c0_g1~~TRINITY_DN5739_c0_g1_i1.p1  ORF type:complete len:472 (+),score=102.13 TRINITY_DN5739_c0_g1_i1:45-1460(+)